MKIKARWFWLAFFLTISPLWNPTNSAIFVFLNTVNFVLLIIAIIKSIPTIKSLLKKKGDKSPSHAELKNQLEKAEELYRKDPKLAIRIAMGEENAPGDILPAVIYAKVCEEAEKSENIKQCGQIANSFHNSRLSEEAQKFNLRDPYSAIEAMKQVVNARRKAFEKTLPKGKTIEDAINEEVKKIEKEIAAQKE